MSKIILPEHVRDQLRTNQAKETAQTISPELLEEMRPYFESAKEIDTLLEKFMLKGESALAALMTQSATRDLIQKYLNGIIPQVSMETVRRDRSTLIQSMIAVRDDRVARQAMKKEELDLPSYNAAIEDLKSLCTQIPAPRLQMIVATPTISKTQEPQQTPQSPPETPIN